MLEMSCSHRIVYIYLAAMFIGAGDDLGGIIRSGSSLHPGGIERSGGRDRHNGHQGDLQVLSHNRVSSLRLAEGQTSPSCLLTRNLTENCLYQSGTIIGLHGYVGNDSEGRRTTRVISVTN